MKILEVTPDKKLTLKDHISGQLKKAYAKSAALTAISRKVVGKMCTRQPRKVIWDMINTLFLTTVAVEPTFVAFH